MGIKEKIKLCDRLIIELAKHGTIKAKDIEKTIGSLNSNDLNNVLNTLSRDGLIIYDVIDRYMTDIEITSLGLLYKKKGYSQFLKDKAKSVKEPIKYYKHTRYVSYIAIAISILSLLISLKVILI
ncbi:MAG: hypothetical protein LBF69_05250 [Prevotellaceae bacterium]|jgi:transcription initiation factor IIE alpha subunit|nr:hypothetical protein [Prevotellaceae bacterium]